MKSSLAALNVSADERAKILGGNAKKVVWIVVNQTSAHVPPHVTAACKASRAPWPSRSRSLQTARDERSNSRDRHRRPRVPRASGVLAVAAHVHRRHEVSSPSCRSGWLARGSISCTARPVARGRELFGALVPWGRIWTPSADSAARITLSTPIEVNGSRLAAGTYSIWTIPDSDDMDGCVQQRVCRVPPSISRRRRRAARPRHSHTR